jgi:cell division protein FtsW (lipid II flippase)
MNGIEILSSETIYNTFLPGWLGITGFFMIIVFTCLAIYFASDCRSFTIIVCLILTVCGIVLMVAALVSNHDSINRIEYKVTIDDSVSMNEFLDKYEILDQEGKIYTVKEKNNG